MVREAETCEGKDDVVVLCYELQHQKQHQEKHNIYKKRDIV